MLPCYKDSKSKKKYKYIESTPQQSQGETIITTIMIINVIAVVISMRKRQKLGDGLKKNI